MRRLPTSWSNTLSRLGFKRRRQSKTRHRTGRAHHRRPSLEQLESRELLTGTPWAGTELVIGDFDGDGNPDRLRADLGGSNPETWIVDTKASAAAGTVENWRVNRAGSVPASGMPTANEVLVGDFNGDGRDDLLARTGASSWYMIQSRASSSPASYNGEFYISSWGNVSTAGGWASPIVGDFNGDGRDDLAAYNDSNPADKQWQVATSTGTTFNSPATWAAQTTFGPAAGSIVAADFNGDGRDDLLFKKSGTSTWATAVSDGSRFNVFDSSISTTWTSGHTGDFDADQAQELLGWNTSAGRWETLRYSDRLGLTLDTSWGAALGTVATGQNLHIGDANRDGRDDLVVFNSSAGVNKWQAALSQPTATGTNTFSFIAASPDGTNDWDRWFTNWDWGPAAAPYGFLNIDAPYQKFLDIFSDVYNTVELELYPGLMKGIEATAQTKAGNDWDQAALLVDRLEAAGFDADIAYGTVTANGQQAALWGGAKNNVAAYGAIHGTLDGGATLQGDGSIRFKHAWVQAIVPTATGFTTVDVDPSWKFKDRQAGISTTPNAFDEFDYLSQGGYGNKLPVEYFEDQVMNYLVGTPETESLAEVSYDGPILRRQFAAIPAGMGTGVTILDLDPSDPDIDIERFDNLGEVATDAVFAARFTHRAMIAMSRELNSETRTVGINPPSGFAFAGDYLPGAMYAGAIHDYEAYYPAAPGSLVTGTPTATTDSEFITEFNPSGAALKLDGNRTYLAIRLPAAYRITASTRIRFDMRGEAVAADGDRFVFGYDDDQYEGNSSSHGELWHTAFEDLQNPRSFIVNPMNEGTDILYIVIGSEYVFRSEFGNILIYEDRGDDGGSTEVNSNGLIVTDRTDYASLVFAGDGYPVYPGTLLEVEFASTQPGALHAIGWDNDLASTQNSPVSLYQLSGSIANSAYSTNFTVERTPDGWDKYTIPIGSGLSSTSQIKRLVFHTDTGTSSSSPVNSMYRNIRLLTAADIGADGEHWATLPIVIPEHSLSSIKVDYDKTENSPATSTDDIFRSRLWINDAIVAEGTASEVLQVGDSAKIRIHHLSPSEFGIAPPESVADKTYTREPGQILAVSFDANQYSSDYIVALQAELNDLLVDGSDDTAIDELLSDTGAKYWYEFNRSNRAIDGLMHTIGGQQWVGSGIVTADPYLLEIPDSAIAHLQFPIVPHDIGVDLPNVTHASFDITSGSKSYEAFQLMSFNASALENGILEEVVDSESISTIRGLQRAYSNRKGLRYDDTTISREAIQVFDSVEIGGVRTIYFRGEIGTHVATPYVANRTNMTRTRSQLLSLEDGGLKNHVSEATRIADILDNTSGAAVGTIRVLVPRSRSQLGDWSGTVYVAEYDTATGRSGAYTIAPDGGTPTSGGYSGNVAKSENKYLPPATFLNQTYAGDPVNVANGNMFRDDVDFTFANPIIPLDFARHYDSQNKLDVGFGVGWVHSFTGFVYEEDDPAHSGDKDFIWLRGNGERHVFEDSDYKLPNTLYGDIVKDSNGLTSFLDRSGVQYIFASIAGGFTDTVTGKRILSRLVAIKNAAGNQGVNITYESGNSTRVAKVESISVPSRYLTFAYTTNNIDVKRYEGGQLLSTWAYVLATNATAYSGKRLTQVKHANLATTVTGYEYYLDGPATRKGLMKQITEPNGESHSYEYYANGRVFRVTDGTGHQQSYSYNLFRNLTEFTDENGHVETYIHQDNGLLNRQIHDDRSRVVFTWGPPTGSGLVQWEEFLMESSTGERGEYELFDYYPFDPNSGYSRPGELHTSTSKDGIVTTYTYNNHFYISSVATVTETPPSGTALQTAHYTYDTNGNVLTATDAAGHTTSYEYYDSSAPAHLRGLRKSVTQPKGVSGQTLANWETYEAVPWKTLADSFTISGDTISVQLLTTTVLNQFVAADAIRIDRIDEDGRLTRIIDSTYGGSDPNFRFESGLSVSPVGSSPAYGAQSFRIAKTNSEQVGATWIFRDLEQGTYRISANWEQNAANSLGAKYRIYDGLSDGTPDLTVTGISQQIAPDSFRSYQTVFEYDTAGNLTRSITEGLPSGYRAYDTFGNVVYEEDATGVASAFTYDTLGRLVKSSIVDPRPVTFSAGPSGNVLSFNGTGGWDVSPNSYAVLDDGNTLYLYDGARKGVALNYTVTPNTVLEFDFEARGSLGEFQAIGLNHSLNAQAVLNFALAGTRNGDWPDVVNWQYHGLEAGTGLKHFRIPIGTHVAAGVYEYLSFSNQDLGTVPAGPANEGKSYFSNIRVYEAAGVGAITNSYDYSGRVTSTTNALNRTTKYTYDAAGRLVKTTFADNTFTTHEYDAFGNCITVADELGRTTRYVYDDRNRLIQTIYADGTSTRTRYDGTGQVVATIDERNVESRFTYDKVGHLLTTVTAANVAADLSKSVNKYDARGRLIESVDGNGIVTKYQYDNLDRLVQTTILDKLHVSSSDTSPTVIQSSRPPVHVSTIDYDSNGNVARTAVFDPQNFATSDYVALLNDAATLITTSNENDNKVQVVRSSFDAFGRATEVVNADGTSTSTIYDAAGRVRFTFDELGRKTEYRYDQFGRLERTIQPDPGGNGSGQSPQLRFVRDSVGNVREQWEFFGTYNGATNVWYVTQSAYDARNRLIATTDPNYEIEYTLFDVAGQLVSSIDKLENATYTTYDERGRVIAERLADPDGSGTQLAPVTTYDYDAAGNPDATTDPLGSTTSFEYDSLNRLKKQTRYSALVLDDTADSRDTSFVVNAGTAYPQQFETAVGRDYTAITSSPATATWVSSALEAGTYRISTTWIANPLWATSATASVYRNGVLVGSAQINQTKPPAGFTETDGTVERAWQILAAGISVSDGDTISVQLTKSAGPYLVADAVRIDKLATTSYTYDDNGNRLTETDTRDYTTSYQFDELNRQIKITTPDPDRTGYGNLGLVTDTVYDGYGNVIKTVEDRGTRAPTTSDDRTNTFEYDRRNRLTREVRNYSATVANDKNVTTQYEYDNVGNTILVTDAEGYRTRYRYDNLDRQIDEYQDFGEGSESAVAVQLGTPTVSASGGYWGTIGISGNSSITLGEKAWYNVSIGNYAVTPQTVLEFRLQVDHLPERVAVGFDTNATYDFSSDFNRMFDLGGALDAVNAFQQDFRQVELKEGIYDFHIPIGQYLTPTEQASGLSISHLVFYSYDNRPLSGEDIGLSTFANLRLYESDEVRTVTTYDTRGNVETVREASDPRNITTRYRYDVLGRPTDVFLDSGGAQERHYRTQYDANGNVTYEENLTAGTATVHEYDRLNRRTKTTLPDPDNNPATYNGLIDKFTYDVAGNLIKTEHGFNESTPNSGVGIPIEVTRSAYDRDGRMISEWDGNGDETRYRYDSEGNLTAVIDAEQNVTTYKYDGLNRVTSDTNAFGTRTYVYDAKGNLERLFNRNVGHIQFTYDTLDRPVLEYWRVGGYGSNPANVQSWAYDKLGRIIKQVDGGMSPNYLTTSDDIVDTFVYDGLGRIVEERNYDPATATTQGQLSGLPRIRQTYEYKYVAAAGVFYDATLRKQYFAASPTDVLIAQTQTQTDRLGRLEATVDVDPDGSTSSPQVATKAIAFQYDTAGNLSQISRTTGSALVSSALGYDKANRVTSITHDLAIDVVHSYIYDNASRVTSFNTIGTGTATRGYTYDDAGQLTSKIGGSVPESYTYDDNGNRELVTNVQGANQDYVPGLANRLTSDGTYSYDYDNEGNVVRRTPLEDIFVGNPVLKYAYDHRNRLTGVTWFASTADADAGANSIRSVTYTYDAQGRRVKRKLDANGAAAGGDSYEYFLYDGDELSMTFGSTGSATPVLEHRYLSGPAVDQVLVDEVFAAGAGGQRVSDEVLWLLADQQGTVRDIADDNGTLRKHVDYDSFGRHLTFATGSLFAGATYYDASGQQIVGMQPWIDAVAADQLFGYTGQEWDEEAGLYNNNARWYDSGTGRFMSEDPTGLAGGDANLYRFVGNSPLNGVDPTGTTQAGNPLANLNLYAGGYSGNKVTANKPVSTAIASGYNAYSTVKAVDQYFFNQQYSLQNLANPNPLSAGTTSIETVSNALKFQEFQSAQSAAIDRSITKSVVLPGLNLGQSVRDDWARIGDAWLAQRSGTNHPLDPQYYSDALYTLYGGLNYGAGYVSGFVYDIFAPPSPPSQFDHHTNNVVTFHDGEGLPTIAYANQASGIVPLVLPGVSRPTGQLLMREPDTIAPSSAKFGSAEFGNSAHSRFGGALTEQTGTEPQHWFMRTDPGMTGVDATYIGPKDLNPGLQHAELKPYSQNGFNTFQRQLDNWNLPPGETQLWWYNKDGIIGSSGTNW